MAIDWNQWYKGSLKDMMNGKKTNCGKTLCPVMRYISEKEHPYTRIEGRNLSTDEKISAFQGDNSLDSRLTDIQQDAIWDASFEDTYPSIAENFDDLQNNSFTGDFALSDAVLSITQPFFQFENEMEENTEAQIANRAGKHYGWDSPRFKQAVRDANFQTKSAYYTKNFNNYVEKNPETMSNVFNGLPKLGFDVEVEHPNEKKDGKITYKDPSQVLFDQTKKGEK